MKPVHWLSAYKGWTLRVLATRWNQHVITDDVHKQTLPSSMKKKRPEYERCGHGDLLFCYHLREWTVRLPIKYRKLRNRCSTQKKNLKRNLFSKKNPEKDVEARPTRTRAEQESYHVLHVGSSIYGREQKTKAARLVMKWFSVINCSGWRFTTTDKLLCSADV